MTTQVHKRETVAEITARLNALATSATAKVANSYVPSAPFYVTAIDRFMSNWGNRQGAYDKVVVPCATYEEALKVEALVSRRPEMMRVSITEAYPRSTRTVKLSPMNTWRKQAGLVAE